VPEVIADTSPIQYLYQTGLLNLPPTLYGKVIIPPAVASELEEGRRLKIALPDINTLSWLEVKEVGEKSLLTLASGLGRGEREVIILAEQTPSSLAILDDALARQQARHLGLTFTGTLGVLLRAKQAGHLDAIAQVLERLEQLRFRLAPATRAALLNLAGE
jgi:uncharacterized protein